MLRRSALLCLFIVLCSCCSYYSHAQPQDIKVRYMRDYFVLHDNLLRKPVNCLVITNRYDMDKIFGTTTRPDTPDFSKEWLLVLAMPGSKKESKLSFDRISVRAGNFIEVYCTVKKNLYPLTYVNYPIVVAVVPKSKTVKEVHYYHTASMELIESVTIKQDRY